MTPVWRFLRSTCRHRATRCFTTSVPRHDIRSIAELPPRVNPIFKGEAELLHSHQAQHLT